jgi:hypothetical protein
MGEDALMFPATIPLRSKYTRTKDCDDRDEKKIQ